MGIEISPLNVLAVLAMGLLVAVTSGVIYLTAVDWRDRRRLQDEKRETRRKKKRGFKKKS
ncbi:MAG: hypothetical protein AAGD25_40540 [Cyanobacteria bacterium P01_F01_bin.150]